jgi:hypothetical protein
LPGEPGRESLSRALTILTFYNLLEIERARYGREVANSRQDRLCWVSQ